MAGKSFVLAPAVCLLSLALMGCPSTISQRVNSGKDYRVKGAKKIKKDGAKRWRSGKDVVTYPGGDRVDWKVLEIPEDAPAGNLTITVRFDTPRPGLDLAFDVFDAYNKRIGRAKPSKGDDLREREMEANTKKVSVNNAGPGKYYVMIYAPRRTDAARYRVRAKLSENKVAVAEEDDDDFPLPPKLPAIPDAPEEKPPEETPQPQPCPNDPSRMQPDCEEIVEAKPVKGQIVDYTLSARGGIIIVIGRGTKDGVQKGWTGAVVDGGGSAVEGGEFTVFEAKARRSKAKVKLSVDQVKANRKVIINPK